jgi:hypothetical protein
MPRASSVWPRTHARERPRVTRKPPARTIARGSPSGGAQRSMGSSSGRPRAPRSAGSRSSAPPRTWSDSTASSR